MLLPSPCSAQTPRPRTRVCPFHSAEVTSGGGKGGLIQTGHFCSALNLQQAGFVGTWAWPWVRVWDGVRVLDGGD